MPRADGQAELYPQILRRMTEHGEYDRLLWMLTQKLSESGWVDDFRDKSKELARNVDNMPAETMMNELLPQAEASILPKVRQEIVAMIRQFLDKQVEG